VSPTSACGSFDPGNARPEEDVVTGGGWTMVHTEQGGILALSPMVGV
jgi:hypothetical protein